MGYVNVKELWYAIDNAMHMLEDDKGAINMMHIVKHYGQVHMFVVHGISEAEVVENDLEGTLGYKCGDDLESRESNHINDKGEKVQDEVDKVHEEVDGHVGEVNCEVRDHRCQSKVEVVIGDCEGEVVRCNLT